MVLTHAVDVAGPTELLGVLFTRLGLALSISSSIFDPTTEVIRGWVMSRGSRSLIRGAARPAPGPRPSRSSEMIGRYARRLTPSPSRSELRKWLVANASSSVSTSQCSTGLRVLVALTHPSNRFTRQPAMPSSRSALQGGGMQGRCRCPASPHWSWTRVITVIDRRAS